MVSLLETNFKLKYMREALCINQSDVRGMVTMTPTMETKRPHLTWTTIVQYTTLVVLGCELNIKERGSNEYQRDLCYREEYVEHAL